MHAYVDVNNYLIYNSGDGNVAATNIFISCLKLGDRVLYSKDSK